MARFDTDAGLGRYSHLPGGGGDETTMALEVDSSGGSLRWRNADDVVELSGLGRRAGCQLMVAASDAGIAKLNPNGSALVYSTYFGGGLERVARCLCA